MNLTDDLRCPDCGVLVDLKAEIHRCLVAADTRWTIRDHDGTQIFPYLPFKCDFFSYWSDQVENPSSGRHARPPA